MGNDILSNIWPEWEIEGKPLGRGSYGVVYKAVRRDHNVESYAAIKVISIPSDSSEVDSLRSEGLDVNATRTYLQGIVNDFVSEIQLMESFKGVQNIVSVEDYKVVEKADEIGWDIYIRMELLTPFNSYICDKMLTEQEVIKLGCDICTALELCAKRNVIHRDIKPENIFINQFGDFKLGDFGIARKLENVTGGLSQKGTYNYMAPEIERSAQYDATVDLYSLGLVLYRFMNKNRLPFLDTEQQLLNPAERMAALRRRLDGEPLPVPCEASPAMAEIILCACSPEPSRRFASAAAMKNALMSVANGAYSVNGEALNKTMSVRRASQTQDLNKTTSVRKAPQAQQAVQKPVKTFGKKKKSKVPAIIAAALAAVILIGGGIFAVPKFLNNMSDGASANSGGSELADVYLDLDENHISAVIKETENLPSTENREEQSSETEPVADTNAGNLPSTENRENQSGETESVTDINAGNLPSTENRENQSGSESKAEQPKTDKTTPDPEISFPLVIRHENLIYDCYSDGTATLTDGNKATGAVSIPSTIKYGSQTFRVTIIGEEAFAFCSKLTSIEMPKGVTSIEDEVFWCCSNLTSIKIPESVVRIGAYAFAGCESLTSIEIPKGVTSIEEGSFWLCRNLAKINIPKGVVSIGAYAFKACSNLTSIEIPEGVTGIEVSTFESCSNLTSIEIPKSVTSIGAYAFESCSNLTSIEIPESVTSIGEAAFWECSKLTRIEIPEGVTRIEDDIFYGCSSLWDIEIPQSVTSIGAYAFAYCSKLTYIRIPKGVKSVGEKAFTGCKNWMTISYGGRTMSKAEFRALFEL